MLARNQQKHLPLSLPRKRGKLDKNDNSTFSRFSKNYSSLGRRVNVASRKAKNSSVVYHKTKNPLCVPYVCRQVVHLSISTS